MRTLLFACAAALAGCHSAPPPAAPASASAAAEAGPMPTNAAAPLACGKVSDHLVGMMPNAQAAPQDAKDKLAGALSQACEQDAWSEDAKACLMAAATHDAAMSGCKDKLTAAQIESAGQRVQTAMGGPPPAAAAAPAVEAEPAAAEPSPPPPPAGAAKKSANKPRRAQPVPKAPGKTNGDPCDGSE